jgi:GntR family transcriptional regulator
VTEVAMQLRISDQDGVPIYVQLVNQIKYLVSSGRLEPGEQLPPVRKLAEQLVINPNTVARAYRELDSEGVLISRQGSGVFVADGVSPLARREQNRILQERIDVLLTEARQMRVDVETLIKLIRQRSENAE